MASPQILTCAQDRHPTACVCRLAALSDYGFVCSGTSCGRLETGAPVPQCPSDALGEYLNPEGQAKARIADYRSQTPFSGPWASLLAPTWVSLGELFRPHARAISETRSGAGPETPRPGWKSLDRRAETTAAAGLPGQVVPSIQILIGITTASVFSSSGGVIREGESSSWKENRISFIWIALIASSR